MANLSISGLLAITEYKIEADYSIIFATYGLAAFIATVIIIFTGQLRADGQSKETIKLFQIQMPEVSGLVFSFGKVVEKFLFKDM